MTGSHAYTDVGRCSIIIGVADAQASTTTAAIATMREELLREGRRGSTEQQYISEVDRDLLGRQAEPLGRDFWVGHRDRGEGGATNPTSLESTACMSS